MTYNTQKKSFSCSFQTQATPWAIKSFLLLILLCFAQHAFGKKVYTPSFVDPLSETWRWQSYPQLDGMDVRCMTEDKEGNMWFGLKHGVVKYDGLRWTRYNEKSKGFGDVIVTDIHCTPDNAIIVGTKSGLFIFKKGVWKKVYPFNEHTPKDFLNIFCVRVLHDGSIVASIGKMNSPYSGLLIIHKNKVGIYCSRASMPFYKNAFPASSLQMVDDRLLAKNHFFVNEIFQDKQKRVWMVVLQPNAKGKLLAISGKNTRKKNFLDQAKIYTEQDGIIFGRHAKMEQLPDGSIWMVNIEADKGVSLFNGKSWKGIDLSQYIGYDNSHASIVSTPNDGLWIGGFGNIKVRKNGVWKSYERPELPVPNTRIHLHKDSKGYVWILGFRSEVLRVDYSSKKWKTYQYLNYQCHIKNKNYFISVDDRVVVQEGKKWYSLGTEDGLPSFPTRVFKTRKGQVWVSGSQQGVACTAYLKGKQWIKELHPALSWSIDNRALFEDSKGRLWFGCATNLMKEKGQKGGVLCLANPLAAKHKWKHYPSTEELEFRNAYGIAESKDGRIWTGGTMLRFFKEGKWHGFEQPENANTIDFVSNIPNGLLWAGSRIYGLHAFDGEKWTNYNVKNGLVSNSIIDITPHSNDHIWVATEKDISHFDGKAWTNNVFPQQLNLIREAGELYDDEDGRIWINSSNFHWKRRPLVGNKLDQEMRDHFKTTSYHLDTLGPNTKIVSYNEEVPYPGTTTISWTGEDSWGETPKERLSYSYKINEGEWSPFEEKNSHTFIKLKSGHNTISVRARDLDFNIDPSPVQVNIYAVPPIWKQTWFVTLIIIFLLIIAFYQMRLQHRNDKLLDATIQLEHQNREILEQKEQIIRIAKREQTGNQLRIKFFTHISHEFRTPLTLILSSLDRVMTLDPTKDKANLSKYLLSMQRNTQQMLKLINQLMDFRKVDNKTMQLKVKEGNIVKTVEEIAGSFQSLIEAHEIKFEIKKEAESILAWYDYDKIEKILSNLISNAVKFTPKGGIIRVSIKEEDDKKFYTIAVEDTGIGIPEDEIEKIIEPFYQTQNKALHDEAGTGIGLSLVNNLVVLHQGELSIRSKAAKNKENPFVTCFKVKLPLGDTFFKEEEKEIEQEIIPEDASESSNTNESFIPNNSNRAKLLIIDDNKEIRELVMEILGDKYDYIEAENGEIGLQKAVEFLPDLVISDVMMPVMDGIACCSKIKSNPLCSHIPVILLTANDGEEQMLSGFETGADAYITKPFNAKILALRVKNILENKLLLQQKFKTEISLEPKSLTITSIDADFIEKIIEIVDKNIQEEDFDVEKLSDELHISVRQLHNKLTALTDMSPGEFIRVYKLKRAAEMLVKKQTTISEVAYEFGFSNPKYFSKCFRQQFGVSPSEYLKKNGL